jgi:hypothetical protein
MTVGRGILGPVRPVFPLTQAGKPMNNAGKAMNIALKTQ